jgi:PAS domain S-box-containing protein
MNLRNKTLLAIGITFTCVFAFFLAIALPLTFSSLDRLEFQTGQQGVLQTKAALDSEMNYLQGTAQDWSWWDEMDRFVQGDNPGFEMNNLNRENVANIRVNVLIIRNDSGAVIYAKGLNADFSKEVTIPDATIRLMDEAPLAATIPGTTDAKTGIIMMPDGPMIAAFSPVLPSSAEGPPHGILIIGRYLGSGVLTRISDVIGYPVSVVPSREISLNLPESSRLPAAGGSGIFVRPVNDSVVMGVLPVSDVNGQDLFIITNLPRTLYRSSLVIVLEFLLLFLMSVIVTMAVVALVLDRTVLQPLDQMSSQIQVYESANGEMPPPVMTGNDELARLETAIRTSHRNLVESEKRFRQVVETSHEGICILDLQGIVIFANDQLAAMLGYSSGEIIGKPYMTFIPMPDRENQEAHHDTARRGLTEQYEGRLAKKDGSVLWAHISTTPVIERQTYTGSFAMITDITDRKLTEDALQRATRKLGLLNSVTFNDIQNSVFTLSGYIDLEKKVVTDEKLQQIRAKQKNLIRSITESLDFASDYQNLGLKPPVWQNVSRSFLLGVSHLGPMRLSRILLTDNIEIFADPLLENVFQELVDNVVVHAPTATEISLTSQETTDGLLLRFEDNGAGVPFPLKARIFERGSEKKKGLGLYLVQEILGITGISITESGEPGSGARFEILVPHGAFRFVGK